MNYQEFLEMKKITPIISGFDVDAESLNENLFDFQRVIVKWALKRGRAAIFADTGLGKTLMQTSWAQSVVDHTDGDVLIVAPLCVAQQTVREGVKFGIDINFCRDQINAKPGINITNYEMLDRFNLDDFHGIVLDECFPWDTKIDVLRIDDTVDKKYIKDICIGDRILNASGVDVVSDVHRREVQYAIKITANGKQITSSPNHPYFTQRGWVGAIDLRAGDHIVETSSAMRVVQGGIHAKGIIGKNENVLREILLSEMADAPTGEFSESSLSGSCDETRVISIGMASIGQPEGKCGDREGASIEPNEYAGSARKIEPNIESHEAQTFRAWGERKRINSAAVGVDGCVIRELDCGISYLIGETKGGLSDLLQSGLSLSREENRNRGGWAITLQPEGSRLEEGCDVGFARVDCVEILEQGHTELEKYRDANGKLYFYDLGGTRHPSFSINGLLVHNSSIIKNRDGKTRNAIISACQSVPYRLSCTATPSPNDFMELGNQSEFLGIMNMVEMLAMFFINDAGDTGTWALKGHGKAKFWEWLSTWACVIRSPSDLGFDGSAYVLPKLNMFDHVVESKTTDGLFADIACGLMDRNKARKESIDDRVNECFSVITSNFCDKLPELNIQGINHGMETGTSGCAGRAGEVESGNSGATASNGEGEPCAEQRKEESVHQGIQDKQSGEVEEDSGATRNSKCEAQGEICDGRRLQGKHKSEGEGISREQSACEKAAKNKIRLRSNDREFQQDVRGLQSSMSDLRSLGQDAQNEISTDRSLPQFGQSTRDTLHKLQSGHREVHGQSGIIKEGRSISGKPFWFIWCHRNEEQEKLEKLFGDDCFSVSGSDETEEKERKILAWIDGERPVMISKPKIMGSGLNFQHCHNTAFVGLSDSWEQYYQAIRRFYRFGQESEVNVHVISAESEGAVVANIKRKEEQNATMGAEMVKFMSDSMKKEIFGAAQEKTEYNPQVKIIWPSWI